MNKYGLRLKELREKNGYTQETLAKQLNTSRSRIGMYEQGKRQPDFEMQEAIADLFNVSIDYLFGREKADVNKNTIMEIYDPEVVDRAMKMYKKYLMAIPEIQAAVESLLKDHQPDA